MALLRHALVRLELYNGSTTYYGSTTARTRPSRARTRPPCRATHPRPRGWSAEPSGRPAPSKQSKHSRVELVIGRSPEPSGHRAPRRLRRSRSLACRTAHPRVAPPDPGGPGKYRWDRQYIVSRAHGWQARPLKDLLSIVSIVSAVSIVSIVSRWPTGGRPGPSSKQWYSMCIVSKYSKVQSRGWHARPWRHLVLV
jgi:hypothetical protein